MFDLQKLVYFTEGNVYTGSHSEPDGRLLRYRVAPDKENERLLAWSWREDWCFERVKEKQEGEFPLSETGLEQVKAWLEKTWSELKPE